MARPPPGRSGGGFVVPPEASQHAPRCWSPHAWGMAAIWSGQITFGLVSLPVQLHPATREARPRLHEVHAACGSRVRHRRVCEAEGRELRPEEIARGWQTPDGRMVVLRNEDLDDLPLPTRKSIEVLGFVSDTDVDPLMYARPYYASPNGAAAERPYALLVEALAGAGQVAVCKVAIRTRERLAVLRPRQGILLAHTLMWPEEIREPGDWAPSAPVTEKELRLAVYDGLFWPHSDGFAWPRVRNGFVWPHPAK
ncbi:non-homologous end joining protein Ku [Streptomyces sp. NPDC054933]